MTYNIQWRDKEGEQGSVEQSGQLPRLNIYSGKQYGIAINMFDNNTYYVAGRAWKRWDKLTEKQKSELVKRFPIRRAI